MKKIFSILFVFLILLSGMHFTVATHICGGKVAAVRWSFSGEKATCGMENPNQKCANHKGISSNCCQDEVSLYAVDNNCTSSSLSFKESAKNLLHIFIIPVSLTFDSFSKIASTNKYVIPPDIALTSAVSLVDICIFRI